MSGWAKLNWILLILVVGVLALNWGLESDPTQRNFAHNRESLSQQPEFLVVKRVLAATTSANCKSERHRSRCLEERAYLAFRHQVGNVPRGQRPKDLLQASFKAFSRLASQFRNG